MPCLSLAKLERHLMSAADRLRQEGLDAATYKDYIFGMLFLKRCSDVFDAENEKIVARKVEQGMGLNDATTQYGENPDYYDGFFVPSCARWKFLQDKLGDATEVYGSVLDKALAALREANPQLEHVLDRIFFMAVESGKRIVSDDCCKDLVRRIFSRYRLRNEDFQFSDLLGAAYEFLINNFAESAGKKGGDFYTPRDVIRLMVRVLKPAPGISVYDPTCGSGGMLIISREFIEQSGGDPTNLRLCGQVNDASAWSICKLNMLLHGVTGADIQLQDTLLHPQHKDGGELERFDRVIAKPPSRPPPRAGVTSGRLRGQLRFNCRGTDTQKIGHYQPGLDYIRGSSRRVKLSVSGRLAACRCLGLSSPRLITASKSAASAQLVSFCGPDPKTGQEIQIAPN